MGYVGDILHLPICGIVGCGVGQGVLNHDESAAKNCNHPSNIPCVLNGIGQAEGSPQRIFAIGQSMAITDPAPAQWPNLYWACFTDHDHSLLQNHCKIYEECETVLQIKHCYHQSSVVFFLLIIQGLWIEPNFMLRAFLVFMLHMPSTVRFMT